MQDTNAYKFPAPKHGSNTYRRPLDLSPTLRNSCLMFQDDFNSFCAALPKTTHVVQWGGADVWKIGGKVFSIGGWKENEETFAITFKVTEMAFEILPDMPGLRPAPYLASRGMKWIQHYAAPGLSRDELKNHIRASYDMIAAALPKKKQKELGLN